MTKERNYLFDNYKVFLIYLVVLGHFVTPSVGETEFLTAVKWFIFAFHMPAFMFASGFFSKKPKPVLDLVQKLLIPYVIFELLYYFTYVAIGKSTEVAILYPKFTLWFLLSLFWFKLASKVLLKLKLNPAVVVSLSVLVGILWAMIDTKGSFLSNQRAIYFFPYYLLGMYMNMEQVEKLRQGIWKKIAVGIVIAFILFLAFEPVHKTMSIAVTYGRYSYHSLGFSIGYGVFIKCLCYLGGFLLTLAFLAVVPSQKTAVSWIGPNTLAVYLFHGLMFKIVETKTTILQGLDTPLSNILLLLACGVITYIFALKPFNAITNAFSKVPIDRLIPRESGKDQY